jgi:hypothetical protein
MEWFDLVYMRYRYQMSTIFLITSLNNFKQL